jgi:riboflavin synthase
VGVVDHIEEPNPKEFHLYLKQNNVLESSQIGDSISVNGCCLTIADKGANTVRFDLLQETWNKTSFRDLSSDSLVNLERAMLANSRLGGHFVTGHIDGVGKLVSFEKHSADVRMEVRPPEGLLKYFIPKGSVAMDGVSLTVAEVTDSTFVVWIIPHTLRETNFQTIKVGDHVNIEADMIGKYVERFMVFHKSET